MTAPLPRSKVKPNQTWNAESVFESPAEFEAEVESILASLDSFKNFQGHLGDSADTFMEAMNALDVLSQRSARMRVYATMSSAVDTADQASSRFYSKERAHISAVVLPPLLPYPRVPYFQIF